MYFIGCLFQYKSSIFKRASRLQYISPNVWRLICFYKLNSSNKFFNKKLFNRSSTLPYIVKSTTIYIYNGRKWKRRRISAWRIGFKMGELAPTRTLARFKAKQLKKKK